MPVVTVEEVDRAPETLRVITFNLLSPDQADWDRRRKVIRSGLRKLRPDVIALQETVWGNGYEQASDLLGPDYEMARHASRSADGVGAVLASRWPFGNIREVDLHLTERVDDLPWAAAVTAEVLLPEPFGPTLFAHHKPTYQVGYARERELQAVASARLWKRRWRVAISTSCSSATSTTPQTQLACGSSPDGSRWTDQLSVAYRDAWEATHPGEPGHTFTPSNPLVRDGEWSQELGRRIDYVLVRCGIRGPSLQIADCHRIFDQAVNGVWASDHFGVLADLRVPHPSNQPT
jgi:endonuclease/exonuclease/phosphatase family metal-dependent hydrolase